MTGCIKRPGILIFDRNKCHLLFANQEGWHCYGQGKNGDMAGADRDLSFNIKRFCLRLKKLSSTATNGTWLGSKTETMKAQAGNTHYQLAGSILTNESTKDHCLLIVVEEEEEQRSTPKLNLAYYQSTYKLTQREMQVLKLLSKGASYKEIAYTLSISEHTVRDHIKNIRLKLHAESKYGIMAHLIEDPGRQDAGRIQAQPDDEAPSTGADVRGAEPVLSSGARSTALLNAARTRLTS